MCRRATQRPPRLRERLHLLHRRPRFQAEADPHRFLHSEIASRPRIAVTEAEQQINVGGPRPDAMQLRERRMRSVGVFFPTVSNNFAVVYFFMSGLVQVNVPYAPEPFA